MQPNRQPHGPGGPFRLTPPCRPAAAGVALLALAMISQPLPAGAQNTRLPPVIDTLTAPVSENEMAGIGCLVGTVAAGGAVVALAGGLGPVAAALQGPLTPLHVLEGGAALAFLVSSSCYIGQALTPLAVLGWTSMTATPTPAPAGARTPSDVSDREKLRFQKARADSTGRQPPPFLLDASAPYPNGLGR